MKAKKETINEQGKEEIGPSGTFLENVEGKFGERKKKKVEKALMRRESGNVKGTIPGKQEGASKSAIFRQNLIDGQSNDKEFLDLFEIALTPVEVKNVSVGYLIKDNILIRNCCLSSVTIVRKAKQCTRLCYPQYTDERS